MGTFLTFIGLVLGAMILKFIWDSYLTDNAEKNWINYRKRNPVIANNIERYPIRRLPKHLKTKPGNLLFNVPEFIDFFNRLHPALEPEVTANDATRFEFKTPIKTFGKIVGYHHIGIQESNNHLEMYLYCLSIDGRRLTIPTFKLTGKESIVDYENRLNSLVEKMFSDPRYGSLGYLEKLKKEKIPNTDKHLGSDQQFVEKDKNRKSEFKSTLFEEFDLIKQFYSLIIKTNTKSVIETLKTDQDFFSFKFLVNRRNGHDWGLCTVTFSKISDFSTQSLVSDLKFHIRIKNKDGYLYESKPKLIPKQCSLNELLKLYLEITNNLEQEDSGLPF